MKTTINQFLTLCAFGIVCTSQMNARILTVSNQTSPQVAQYTNLQTAQNAAQNGDTIYLYPSLSSYSGINIITTIRNFKKLKMPEIGRAHV